MPTRKLTVRNNQSWALERVSVLEEDVFRKRVIEEVQSGGRIANLFGLLEESGDVRIFALIGQDEQSKLNLCSFRVSKAAPSFQSLSPELPQVHLFEREIDEQ